MLHPRHIGQRCKNVRNLGLLRLRLTTSHHKNSFFPTKLFAENFRDSLAMMSTTMNVVLGFRLFQNLVLCTCQSCTSTDWDGDIFCTRKFSPPVSPEAAVGARAFSQAAPEKGNIAKDSRRCLQWNWGCHCLTAHLGYLNGTERKTSGRFCIRFFALKRAAVPQSMRCSQHCAPRAVTGKSVALERKM